MFGLGLHLGTSSYTPVYDFLYVGNVDRHVMECMVYDVCMKCMYDVMYRIYICIGIGYLWVITHSKICTAI